MPEDRYSASSVRSFFEGVPTGFGPPLAILVETGTAATEAVRTKKNRAYAENNID